MNTYDFDKTVFYPDSSCEFVLYCLRRHTAAVLRALPGALAASLRYAFRGCGTKELKERLFAFLRYLDDADMAVRGFWNEKRGNIGEWYLAQRRDDDVIISASPDFLLRPIAEELGVRLIATDMDRRTGRISGENCHDSEKVRRFRAEYPDGHTENFYSDSLSDAPMAGIADRAYLVKKGVLSPWPEKNSL